LLFLVGFGVAYLMMFAGVSKRAVEWKRASKICPSCGRDAFRDCNCRR
jgi:hypothetical protein